MRKLFTRWNNVILHIYIHFKNYNMFSIYISSRTEVESAVNIILHCFNFKMAQFYYRTAPDSILRPFEMALVQVPRAENNALFSCEIQDPMEMI